MGPEAIISIEELDSLKAIPEGDSKGYPGTSAPGVTT